MNLARPLRTRLRKTVLASVLCTGALTAVAPAALASHLQGGFFTADVTAAGHLTGTLTFLQKIACSGGIGSQTGLPITITSPGGQVVGKTVIGVATVCGTGNSVYVGGFDFPLDTTTFSAGAPDGNYVLRWTSSARVGGIVNLPSSGAVELKARVHKVTGQATGAPFLGSNVATGIAAGQPYSQNLNATDPDGGALTYATLLKVRDNDPYAPDSDVITLDGTGQVRIPSSQTSTYTTGQTYVYKARVTDAQGDFADRDVLLTVAPAGQVAPTITGLSPSYAVTAGTTTVVQLSATDTSPPGTNTVRFSAAGLPSWATLTQTPGSPATATLTLSPPIGTPTSALNINVDATSNSSTPLTSSNTVAVNVTGAPATTVTDAPAAFVTGDTAHFAFTSDDGAATFECSLDGGAWTPCASPADVPGIGAGAHTYAVRATAGGLTDPTPATWTWTRVIVPEPAITARPADVATTTRHELAADPSTTLECAVDGGAFTACTSPFEPLLADGVHTVAVRAIDGLGLPSGVVSHTFTLDTAAPGAPLVLSGPDASTTATTATFSLAGEPGATIECRLDGGAWALCGDTLRLAGLAVGDHTLELRQTDAAGNVSAVAGTRWSIGATAAAPAPSAEKKLTAVVGSTVTVAGTQASVGCRLDGVQLTRCKADVYATTADGKRVLIGKGTTTPDAAGNATTVKIALNRTGRRLVERAGGTAVRVEVQATGTDGRTYDVTRRTRLLPSSEVVLPQDLLFATSSVALSPAGGRYLQRLRQRLQGVASVTCVGHTDDRGAAAANRDLGFARAKRVCAALAGGGRTVHAGSRGESSPRAGNATAAGRALNRRVVVTLHYR